jgi:hypothetical protein
MNASWAAVHLESILLMSVWVPDVMHMRAKRNSQRLKHEPTLAATTISEQHLQSTQIRLVKGWHLTEGHDLLRSMRRSKRRVPRR